MRTLAEERESMLREENLRLREQLESLRGMVLRANSLLRSTDKGSMEWHDKMDEWAADFRTAFEGSNPASESPGRDLVRAEREREALKDAQYDTRHESGTSAPASSHVGGEAAEDGSGKPQYPPGGHADLPSETAAPPASEPKETP